MGQYRLTQDALAEAAGINVSQVRRYEGGNSQPSLDALRKLAVALSVSADELLFDETERGAACGDLHCRTGHRFRWRGWAATELTKSDMQQWHAILNARGWLAVTWPAAHGGTGWTAVQRHIFEEECAIANAPRIVPFGLNMLGPVVIKFGSEAQKAEILPRILNGTDWWCQSYSEPGAGSA